MADVAISCRAGGIREIPINIEYFGFTMSIGAAKVMLRCWRFPRRCAPRNDRVGEIFDGMGIGPYDGNQNVGRGHDPAGT